MPSKLSVHASTSALPYKLHVFGVDEEGQILHWMNGPEWPVQLVGFKAERGTSLTATSWVAGGNVLIRVYYKAEDGLRELCNDDAENTEVWSLGQYFVPI